MYKYFYNGDIHSARDFFEARLHTGIPLPHSFRSFSHYVVRFWKWDPSDEEYSVEVLGESGHQIFNNFDEALNCFNSLAEELPGLILEDAKLELVHYHMGKIYPLESKIVMSPPFAGGC